MKKTKATTDNKAKLNKVGAEQSKKAKYPSREGNKGEGRTGRQGRGQQECAERASQTKDGVDVRKRRRRRGR